MSRVNIIKTGDNYGLCNRLFPFAHLIASAAEYGWEIQNPGFAEFQQHFVGTCKHRIPGFSGASGSVGFKGTCLPASAYVLMRRLLAKAGVERRILLGDHDVCDLSSPDTHKQLERNRTTQCIGLYFCHNQAAMKHAGVIQDYFRPVQGTAESAQKSVERAKGQGDLLIGIHLRHGDYETFCNGIMFYSFEEYADLMRTVRDQLFPQKRVTFLIASNVPLPAEPFREFRYTPAPGHFVADVYALAKCDYILGPPSTFSEWASFYGNVPRYVHLKNDYTWNNRQWPGMHLKDFVPHTTGFARCNPSHPASLIANDNMGEYR